MKSRLLSFIVISMLFITAAFSEDNIQIVYSDSPLQYTFDKWYACDKNTVITMTDKVLSVTGAGHTASGGAAVDLPVQGTSMYHIYAEILQNEEASADFSIALEYKQKNKVIHKNIGLRKR